MSPLNALCRLLSVMTGVCCLGFAVGIRWTTVPIGEANPLWLNGLCLVGSLLAFWPSITDLTIASCKETKK